jgi:hypothetical protein
VREKEKKVRERNECSEENESKTDRVQDVTRWEGKERKNEREREREKH